MKNLSNLSIKNLSFIAVFSLVFCIIIIFLILNINIKKTINAILEVDSEKKFFLTFSTSNINLISEEKSLSLFIENKTFIINDLKITNLGNNRFQINFENEKLYHYIKTNSTYLVNLIFGCKKIYEIIFNI